MIAVGVISIATVVLGIQFKNVKPEYGILLSITGCLIIFIMMLTKLTYIINIFNQISELTNVSKEYIKILLKINDGMLRTRQKGGPALARKSGELI